jgi:Ni,Fe-hydrogenase III large subunit/Ni,Fe-hydrogenase III component G
MTATTDAFKALPSIEAHRPWPRRLVDQPMWRALCEQLAAGHFTLLGLWGEQLDMGMVHMALLEKDKGCASPAVASFACVDGFFPSVSRHHPPAIRLERTIRDLFGLEAMGAEDDRPWLDHGRWPMQAPMGAPKPAKPMAPYEFLTSTGEGLHQIPVGPVHAGIIEPGHFRFTAAGETIVRLEERLGYTHKGVEQLMQGASLERAALLAARVSGDSTVAYQIAFARAVEAALGVEPSSRAIWLRALMAELERVANHLGDIGAICNDAAYAIMLAHCGALRENVLRAAAACFGHRLMMDAILPGGVSVDFPARGPFVIHDLVVKIRKTFPRLVELYDNTASLQDRTAGAGVLNPELAEKFGCGGFVGRASGRDFDARRDLAYAPYDQLKFEVPILSDGDVNARVWLRIREIEQSLEMIDQILAHLPSGEVFARVEAKAGEGAALAEGFRGDILCWVRLGPDGAIARCHLRDPSWFQWPLLEAAIEGNIVADFPLCNKSFNCSYSGTDL